MHLRSSLKALTREIHVLLAASVSEDEDSEVCDRSAVFDLPMELLQERLDKHISAQVEKIREAVAKLNLEGTIEELSHVEGNELSGIGEKLSTAPTDLCVARFS